MGGYAIHGDNVFGLRNHLGLISLDVADIDIGDASIDDASIDDSTILTWRHYFDHTNPHAMVKQLDGNLHVGLQNLISHFGGEWLDNIQCFD